MLDHNDRSERNAVSNVVGVSGGTERLQCEPTSKVGQNRLVLLLLSLVLLALPRFLPGNFWVRVLVQAEIGVLLSLGLHVMVGQVGQFNLGYAAYFAVGAYLYALLASPQHNIHVPFWVLFPLAGVLSGLIAALLAVPTLLLRGDYVAMVTLAFGVIVRLLLNTLDLTGGPQGIINIDHPSLYFYTLVTPRDYYYFLLVLCAVEVFLLRRLEGSRIGRAWAAIREDERAARAVGMHTPALKLLASATAGVPAGLAGAVFAGLQMFISPVSFGLVESIAILAMVIAGGVGNIPGVALGAVALTVVTEPALRRYAGEYRLLIYGLLLILFALFRPRGIWPKRRRTRRPVESAAGPATDCHSHPSE